MKKSWRRWSVGPRHVTMIWLFRASLAPPPPPASGSVRVMMADRGPATISAPLSHCWMLQSGSAVPALSPGGGELGAGRWKRSLRAKMMRVNTYWSWSACSGLTANPPTTSCTDTTHLHTQSDRKVKIIRWLMPSSALSRNVNFDILILKINSQFVFVPRCTTVKSLAWIHQRMEQAAGYKVPSILGHFGPQNAFLKQARKKPYNTGPETRLY